MLIRTGPFGPCLQLRESQELICNDVTYASIHNISVMKGTNLTVWLPC
jgi:hypothetical protein